MVSVWLVPVSVRQLYQVSELGEQDPKAVIAPLWLKVVGRPETRLLNKVFRDDIRTPRRSGILYFDIFVSSEGKLGKDKVWQKNGLHCCRPRVSLGGL